ncbi:Gfo/Idh/MocA family protein [Streptococcus infantarius]|mgnify:CR=1 FL=1|jgi:predicted dehydrogenase|uniref:NAD-dependent oxidoreductase n=2 Tax=Streptococcus infantarius TaxID=102684 RepID=A0A380KNT2_9STRE|nr:Gfo/Idh/MocA family oxidoreductase [Streptococcus infantarius]MBK8154938.1 Gfo/Idh/MocA family oxidoreductase [Streptococcus sp.]MCO4464475.1 NAD-dependent oxidoreductase [Streptococcus infantarius subsp. infantarius]EDT46970.1 oxidoreductase, NAD-binding domain protein [Streptococcus infantarius subsp. infantarius ATCC BAA-102]MCO4466866.1 NAD-dependent oxidoreductase [Streptococcus infantarius subsp. infantarius]MCO4472184.1 NAD-dependent oxidoreductase [Streptococcus infantarius subsp. i
MKLAILGTGKIVEEVLPVLKEINGIELSAILSTPRSIEKAEKLAELYAISQASSDYDSILANPDVDTVYVALPNHLHYDYAKKALLAGKHVICEKPFTLTLAEFEDLAKIAEQKNRILLEAITNQYLGNFASIKANLAKLGDIKIVECNYSQYSSRYDAFKRGEIAPAFDPAKGGGALRDLNIYNIHLVVGLFGKPERVQYLANMERGVDTSGILIMDYGNFKAACIGAKDCSADIKSTIQGNKGSIAVLGPTNSMPELSLSLNGQSMTMINENSLNHRMHDEFVAFQAIIEHEDMTATKLALDHSHLVMEVLDQAVNSL